MHTTQALRTLLLDEMNALYFQAMRKARRGELEPLRTLIHESAAVMMELSLHNGEFS